MAIRTVGGGDQGVFLVTLCNVQSDLQSTIAVGDFVEVSTSSNWAIDEHGTNIDFDALGEVVHLHESSKIASVQWNGYNKVSNVPYSGTATRGYAVTAAASQTESYITSSNSSEVKNAVCVAVDVPTTGYMDVIHR